MTNTRFRSPDPIWAQRVVTTVLAGLAVGGVVFWFTQILGLSQSDPNLRFLPEARPTASGAGLGRALGAQAVAPATAAPKTTLKLVAVIARGTHAGSAMIAIDGQKAEPYQPGDEVQPGRFVVELGLRHVGLGPSPQGPVSETLELVVPQLPTSD